MTRRLFTALLASVLALSALALPETPRAAAQGPVIWNAEFYNNLYLLGTPVFTTQYSGMELYWGGSAPGPGVSADNFTARLATDTYFAAGTYRFYILADDAVQLFIDFPADKRPTLTTFDAPRPGEMLTADVTLPAGMHHLQVDFRELTSDAYLYMRWANLATSPTPPTFPVPVAVATGPWTAQYYNNPTLSGTPVVTQTEAGVTHYWGDQAPAPGIPADTFSARWTSLQTLGGGTYEIRVTADDGVRVWVNGGLWIDEWHGATGQVYVRNITLPAGQHWFVVEYYEATVNAFIDFRVTLPGGIVQPPAPQPTLTPVPTGPTATVLAYRLNVRNAPSAIVGQVLTRISRGETYPILGRNSDSTWYQISVGGLVGWVSAGYIQVYATGPIPITGGIVLPPTPTPTPVPTGPTATVLAYRLNVRNAPSVITGQVIARVSRGETYPIVGRNAESTWYQINVSGLVGWVSGAYLQINAEGPVPITSGVATPVVTGYLVTATVNVNIRSGPAVTYARLSYLPLGQSAEVLGRSADGRWWQIRYGGLTGWVSALYTTLQAGADLNRIPVTG